MAPSPSVFVLVPGAGGDGWYWSQVAALLRAAGHEAVAVDLPAADEDAGLGDYADVILGAIDGRTGVTLAGQSMGAFSAPIAAARADGSVIRLALVAPMIPAPGESPSSWWSASGHAAAYDDDGPFDERAAFFHDVPEALVQEAYAREQPDEAGNAYDEPFPLAAWPAVPTTVLLGARDRILPCAFMRSLTRARLGVEADTVDAGHLAPLSRPREVAEWLVTS